ncbi:uncharacterized protein LOC127722003 isoform X2 [Mytilus californianus]|nr:uncharacterized protein LOC127722003 isoform X2 [Mytilus californianus]
MDVNKKVPDKKNPSKMNKKKPSKLNKTKCGMILGLILSAFCSLSSATKLEGDCLQTSVSGFVDNGDLIFHCKCNCQCLQSWRWSGGPNKEDMTNNRYVLPSYKDKISITQNAPGVHEYSIILKATETDLFSSDFTCHNGFNFKQINRSELLQHISPPIQSTVTSTMSSPEQTKTSTMLTHEQTRTSTISTLKPPKTSYNSKLNDDEIVGIVVGSLIVVALVVVVAVFLVNRECNPPKKEQREEQMLMNTTPHVEQDLLTLPEHPRSPPVFGGDLQEPM